ncbi:Peptidase family M1 [Nocardioides terrae]|uniref:Peptidase family M1 n=1 Tax=Nocardioides terrae TaxID=574651 RepID=A0A1I1ELB7_9ACTN|nr:M1 family aminopeptidase [Nocardioides terrae]SFB86268.1 Peptidase family M1 [Nocardioides terrae]
MRTIEVELAEEHAHVQVEVDGERRERRVAYRADGPWGLTRWVDPADGSAYVVFSGALGGAADLLGETSGPADLTPTTVTVRVLGETANPPICVVPPPGSLLAGHHLGFAAGPWRRAARDGVAIYRRRSSYAGLSTPLAETGAALGWMLDFFGGDAPWGSEYVQVLVPDAPWLAVEHPGCVLLSERLLTADPARRVAVLAHEAAHQWIGNLVAPASWPDLGVIEGLAELLGQLACRDLLGGAADDYLGHRRRPAPLALVPGVELRTRADTAGLAEVAGPTQHAELFRSLRDSVGAAAFRDAIRDLVRDRGGLASSAAHVWGAFGAEPREPLQVRLPVVAGRDGASWTHELRGLGHTDPASAVVRTRRAFREAVPAGRKRVEQALAALSDQSLPAAVAAGLATELVGRGGPPEVDWHDPM